MQKKEIKKVAALEMSEDNPYFTKYLKKKDKFISGILNKIDKKFNRRKKGFSKDYFLSTIENQDEYFFLCYMTRKYFLDNIILNFIRIGICIFAVLLAKWSIDNMNRNFLKGPMIVLFFAYGWFHGLLSILYVLAHFHCFLRYKNFVSDSKSALADKINIFYDSDTDRFAGQNYYKQVKLLRWAHEEKKRKRGW